MKSCILGVKPRDRPSFHAGANRVPAGDPYIVISNNFWRNHFGGDPGLVGRELVLNGHSYTVIGVAPAGFRGTNVLNGPDVWVPMMMHEQLFTSMPRMMFGTRRALQFDILGCDLPASSETGKINKSADGHHRE